MLHPLLKTFICVADCGSFSQASEKLYVSSTAIMKQMNQLEEHLGLSLIERTNHGIHLTEAGHSIYKDAKFLISYSEKSIAKAKKMSNSKDLVIRVGTSLLNPCKVFMDLWFQNNELFSDFKLQVVPFEDNHEGILSVIDNIGKEYDVIIGVCDSSLWLNRCNFLPLGNYSKCIAVPVNHPLASKECLELSDLYGETLMMVSRGDSNINDRIRNDIETNHPQIQLEDVGYFYDIEVYNRCEQEGNLLLNIECWSDLHPSLVSIPVNWDYRIPYGILYSLDPSNQMQIVLEELKKLA